MTYYFNHADDSRFVNQRIILSRAERDTKNISSLLLNTFKSHSLSVYIWNKERILKKEC